MGAAGVPVWLAWAGTEDTHGVLLGLYKTEKGAERAAFAELAAHTDGQGVVPLDEVPGEDPGYVAADARVWGLKDEAGWPVAWAWVYSEVPSDSPERPFGADLG